jgi:hypothetical protein
LKKNSHKVSWNDISASQKLSEKFIKKHFKLLDIDSLLLNKNISKKTKGKILLLKEII